MRDGPKRGTRVLGREEDQARALLASLNDAQRAAAMLNDTPPRDILTGNQREAATQDDLGVAQRDLDENQRGMLWSIIEEYATTQPTAVADRRLTEIRNAGLGGIKFGWMGPAARGEPHYYRIQGAHIPHRIRQHPGPAGTTRTASGVTSRVILAAICWRHTTSGFRHDPVTADD